MKRSHQSRPSRRVASLFAPLTIALCAMLASGQAADASLVRVNLGIYGGLASDLEAYQDGGGTTRVMAAVRGDIGGVRLNNVGTRWEPIFYGRPGEMLAIEADITDPAAGPGAGVVFGLLHDGQLISNNSDQTGAWTRAAWATVTGGGLFYSSGVVLPVVSISAHPSGVYVGAANGSVYRSTDGGATWALFNATAPGARVLSVSCDSDPATPTCAALIDNAGTQELYTWVYSGGYTTFVTVLPGATPITVGERVFVHPSTTIPEAPLLFVTGDSPSQSVYRGPNNGATWSTVTEPMHYFQHMEFDELNDRIYAVSGVSNDRGLTWTALPNYARPEGDIHSNDDPVAIDPNNLSRIFVASDWFVGEWTEATGVWTAQGELTVDNSAVGAVIIEDIAQIPDTTATKETFAIAGKAGIGLATDYLSHAGPHPTWTFPIYPMDDGAHVTEVHLQDYDGDGSDIETVFAGNNSGRLYKSSTNGMTAASYSRVLEVGVDLPSYTTDPSRVRITDLAESPSSLDDLWVSFGDWDTGLVGGGLACSTDNGATWAIDPAWAVLGDSMMVQSIALETTRLWVGVGKLDDADPNHQGIYAKIGSLAGCGAGTFTQHVTGTALDTSVVYDVEAPNSSLTYAASSEGLFYATRSGAVWTWQELTGSADPELAKLPDNPDSHYKSIAYNPSPSGYDEEFYAAVQDEIYRIRLVGTTWTVTKVSPSPHEVVNVLLWDELVAGGTGSAARLDVPTSSQARCRKAVTKARANYVKKAHKALARCRDEALVTGVSCPDARAASDLEKAARKAEVSGKCDDDIVDALSENWTGTCVGVHDAASLDACLLEDLRATVEAAILIDYGQEDPGRIGTAVRCQETIGKYYGARVPVTILKDISKCEGGLDKGKVDECPTSDGLAKVASTLAKAASRVGSRCSDADVLALDALGFGGSCAGVSNAAEMADCLGADHEELVGMLLAIAEDAF